MIRILIIFSFFFISACSGVKNVFEFQKKDIVFALKKGACDGNCAVYNLDIYKNRYAVYEGLVNAERYGIYSKKLSKEVYNALKADFEKSSFFNFKDNYQVDLLDAPQVTLYYANNKTSKTITGGLSRPDTLIQLQYKMEKLSGGEGWKLEKAYEVKATNEVTEAHNKTIKNNVIENQIIIEPNPNVFLASWFKKYAQYEIQLMRKIAPNLNYWLITFNEDKIDPKEMLKLLKSDVEIKSAEFNKVVSPREH